MTVNVTKNMSGNMASGWYIASDTRCISVLKLFMLPSSETSDAVIMMVLVVITVAQVFELQQCIHHSRFLSTLLISCVLYLFPCFSNNSISFSESFPFYYVGTQTTTTLDAQCVGNFTGTSAACPLASGVIALALEVK